MKTKSLKIRFESTDHFEKRVAEALKKRKKSVRPKDTIFFSSVTTYQKFMTEQKHVILAAVYMHQPGSMYQLAKIVGRDLANVKRDCDALAMGGFLVLDPTKDGKNTKVPRLKFDYDTITVFMPNLTYSHNLFEAA